MISSTEPLTLATRDNSVSSNLSGVNSIVPGAAAYRSPFLWHSTPAMLNRLGIVFVNQELLIASGLSGTGLATVQYALSMSSP